MKNDRKRPLTPEEKTECEALKAIWELKKKGLGITQEGAGEKLGMSQAAVSHYLNARTALNLPVASQFAKLLRCSIADFSPRLEAEVEAYFTKAPVATSRAEREPEAQELQQGRAPGRRSVRRPGEGRGQPYRAGVLVRGSASLRRGGMAQEKPSEEGFFVPPICHPSKYITGGIDT